ncbi:MAG: hypothetical protein L3J66_10375 [Bacteroidales bacterium]|nr:hypothetical protein [Bacteroidales bacterium]
MNALIKIVIGLITITFVSCAVPARIKNNLTFCYDGKTREIDSILNINGYFQMLRIWERDERFTTKGKWIHKIDTLYTNILFYEDGTFVNGFHNYGENINDYLEEVFFDSEKGKKNPFYKWYNWGIYNIYGDTIKVQYLNNPGLTNTWTAREEWYLIKKRNTIELIASKRLDIATASKATKYSNIAFRGASDGLKASFISLKRIPPPNAWTKRKKWFWCDKNDWIVYKQNLKDSKKKN